MSNTTVNNPNISYQTAAGMHGGSYTENKLQKLRMPPLQGKRFLDLGCNTGFYCNFAQTQGAHRVTGVDVDSQVIRQAKQSYPSVEFFDTGWDVFPDGNFDVVICLSAIHYAKNPIELVNNIRSHLAVGGILILEGGLIGAEANLKTDILIPGWRQVGDRCRHLSHGFVKKHLLREFDWKVVNPSEPRGGDNVPRYVIHATAGTPSQDHHHYQLDLLEYAQCLALSAETIVPAMPSYQYVRQLGTYTNITSADLVSVLSVQSNFAAFVDDIVFALDGLRPLNLRVYPTVPEAIVGPLAQALNKSGAIVEY